MSQHPLIRRSGTVAMAMDPARARRTLTTPQGNFMCFGTVGHTDPIAGLPEPNPQFIRIEQGQFFVEVTLQPDGDQIVARYGSDGAGEGAGDYATLEFGCRVVVDMVRGNPQNAVIRTTLNDARCPIPNSVAGVQTGAAGATAEGVSVPAPMWRFIKLGVGQLLAIETQAGGDVLIHSAGSTHLLVGAAGAHHLEGRVALGEAPLSPPVGATVGPAGTTIPGVPAVAFIPTPKGITPPAPPATIVPYVGFEDGIIRAKDDVQSYIAVDPAFWAWITAVGSHPLIAAVAGPFPTALHSEHGGRNGPGSKHTASD